MPFLNRIRPAFSASTLLIPLVVAAVVFEIAYDNGSYSLPSRNVLAIAVWWAVIVGVTLRTLSGERFTRESLAIGGLLAALCVWTFLSVFWAPSSENAFNEFNRTTLLFGVFVLATLLARRGAVQLWCNGLAIAASLVTVIALISRFFPGSFSDQGLATFLPSVAARLSFPLGYWNGLAIFVALGIPLLLRLAVDSRWTVVRGLAVVPIPAIACVVLLSSSRGGGVTAIVGIVVFVALSEGRWRAGAALLWAALGSSAAIAVLVSRNELLNGPLGTSLIERQGKSAALLVALACLASGAAYAAGLAAVSRFTHGSGFRPKPWLGRGVAVAIVLTFAAGVVASHPLRQFQEFKSSPAQLQSISPRSFAQAHLLSGRGSGRWQFWGEAINQWEHHPVLGEGAGTYEAWWNQHTSFFYPAMDAHSLYLESLGELGLLGFVLTLALAVGGISIGVRRSRRGSKEGRATVAALTAVFAAFAAAAGFDWVWELTAVSVFAFIGLALLSGDPTAPPDRPQLVSKNGSRRARQRRFGLAVAALAGAWLLICAQGIPLLVQLRIKDSQTALKRGDGAAAIRAAMDARNLQPWASGPYLQLALVSEQEGLLNNANNWIESGIKRNSKDWHLWLVAARIETKLGNAADAQQSLQKGVALNPRSPLFAGLASASP